MRHDHRDPSTALYAASIQTKKPPLLNIDDIVGLICAAIFLGLSLWGLWR